MRRGVLLALLLALLAGLVARPAHGDDTRGYERFLDTRHGESIATRIQDLFRGKPRVYWERGLHLRTEGRSLDLHLGYEMQADLIWYSDASDRVEAAAGEDWTTGPILRRSRLYLEGFVLKYWYFRARYTWNFVSEPRFQDLFVEYNGFRDRLSSWLPVMRFGQVKEPISLDGMTGANWTTFAERSMATQAFGQRRNPGIRAHGAFFDGRLTYQAGVYGINAASLGDYEQGSGEAVTVRVTGLPWAPARKPCRFLHVGLSGSLRWNVSESRFRAYPGSAGGPRIVDTGSLRADQVQIMGGEIAWNRDRLSLQGEVLGARVRQPSDRIGHYWGWYGQASYFLTKPCRAFRRGLAHFGRVEPERPVLCPARKGPGAWEIAGQVSFLDLDASTQKGGTAWTFTLGLNWYARDNLRVTTNLIHSQVWGAWGDAGADGPMTTLLVRFQWGL